MSKGIVGGIQITGDMTSEFFSILTPDALVFLSALSEEFNGRITEILRARVKRQQMLDAGELPDFLPETKKIRSSEWMVDAIPHDLKDRRVEITGPVERKMIINALNSGAKVFMADLEDSHSPTWKGTVQGQINLRDAVAGSISYESPEGKKYTLNPKHATLIVRPRGWHLPERHMLLNGKPMSGALFDFGLFFFHNAKKLMEKGSGPYFYLPKTESHVEARLWNDIFLFTEKRFGYPVGVIKATVLIETILATFEMEEILFELKEHIVGLNCGRWDYIFSFIKKFSKNPNWIFPDRAQVTMTCHFLRSYSQLLIKTCHKHGAYAMGGMSAFIPIKGDEEANNKAIANVKADKTREANDGHDGTWVAHPGLVPVAQEVFDRIMPEENQLGKLRQEVNVTAKDLLTLPPGTITEEGMRNNISVAIQYIESWLQGKGCVPIFNLMEDAATAEISRTQLWQWVKYPKAVLHDGREITTNLFHIFLQEELEKIKTLVGQHQYRMGKYILASQILDKLVTSEECAEFLTLEALEYII